MASKYNAVKQTIDGYTFDSKREAHRYTELLLLQRDGKISMLRLQPAFELQPAFVDGDGKKQRPIVYKGDFGYVENGRQIIEDVKGFKLNKVWLIKQKMFLYHYPTLTLRITE